MRLLVLWGVPTIFMSTLTHTGKIFFEMFLARPRQKSSIQAKNDPANLPLAISPDTRVSPHADGLTILHIPSGKIFVCNRTAARIWQGAAEGKCLAQLSEEMSRHFGIGVESAQRDAAAILKQMEALGLIVRGNV
jgi:hypothetical protein